MIVQVRNVPKKNDYSVRVQINLSGSHFRDKQNRQALTRSQTITLNKQLYTSELKTFIKCD